MPDDFAAELDLEADRGSDGEADFVPDGEPDAEDDFEPDGDADAEDDFEPDGEADAEADFVPDVDFVPAGEADFVSNGEPDAVDDFLPDGEPDFVPDGEAGFVPESEAEPEFDGQVDPECGAGREAEDDCAAELGPEGDPEPDGDRDTDRDTDCDGEGEAAPAGHCDGERRARLLDEWLGLLRCRSGVPLPMPGGLPGLTGGNVVCGPGPLAPVPGATGTTTPTPAAYTRSTLRTKAT